MSNTRSKDLCPVLGSPKTFAGSVLPTFSDIIRCYLLIRQKLLRTSKQEPSLSDICIPLVKDLKSLWKKSSLTVVSDQQILHKVREYHKKYRNIKKSIKNDGKLNMSEKVVIFREWAE